MDPRLKEILTMLAPPAGKKLWFGGASPVGCLRGVTAKQAAWKPAPDRHSIWEYALHIAYWNYAVRRNLEGSRMGAFPRSPSNWPEPPADANERAWKSDRALVKSEHEQLVAAVRAFDPRKLDKKTPGSGANRYADLLFGVAMHDVYHVGQIQQLKRLVRDAF
jgi:uncharacterized damage-inducible protein DinB